jgi:hypothetical protein
MVNGAVTGRKRSWPILRYYTCILMDPDGTLDVPVEILTEYHHKRSQRSSHYANLLNALTLNRNFESLYFTGLTYYAICLVLILKLTYVKDTWKALLRIPTTFVTSEPPKTFIWQNGGGGGWRILEKCLRATRVRNGDDLKWSGPKTDIPF